MKENNSLFIKNKGTIDYKTNSIEFIMAFHEQLYASDRYNKRHNS